MNQLNNGSFKGSTAVKTEPYEPYESDDIQSKLERKLGPEYVSTRPGAGGVPVSYIEGWKAINLANQVFGFNGWFSEVKNINIDYLDERQGKYSVGLSIVVRVTLKDGSYHEDVGYGSLDNARTKAMAFEKAKKEAMTDGLKRALRCFGNAMGNCLYDKEYLSKISSVKCAPPDFDESTLFRFNEGPSRPATLPPIPSTTQQIQPQQANAIVRPKQEPQSQSLRSGSKHIPQQKAPTPGPAPRQSSTSKAPLAPVRQESIPPAVPEKRASTAEPEQPSKKRSEAYLFDDSMNFSDDLNLASDDINDEMNELIDSKRKSPTQDENVDPGNALAETIKQHNDTPSRPEKGSMNPPSEQMGFYKARVAEELQKSAKVSNAHIYDTSFLSPSVRRTVDPTKSTPIKRTDVQPKSTLRYDNPQLNANRRVGQPRYPQSRVLKGSTQGDASTGP